MTRVKGVLIAGVCLIAALALSLLAPSEELLQSPYVTTIPEGGVAVSTRDITVAVTGARLADRVQTDEWTGVTNGVWLVVDVEFARRLTAGGIKATFRIGDTDYDLSNRAGLATIDQGVSSQPGIPWAGSLLIELPTSALDDREAAHAVIRLAATDGPLNGGELDGALDYAIDLTALEHERSITITDAGRISPTELEP